SGAGPLTTTNSARASNTSAIGGGVFNGVSGNQGGASTLMLTNSTLSGNSANVGGGVYNKIEYAGQSAELTLSRSLLSGNTALTGAEVANSFGTIAADTYNLLGHSNLTN